MLRMLVLMTMVKVRMLMLVTVVKVGMLVLMTVVEVGMLVVMVMTVVKVGMFVFVTMVKVRMLVLMAVVEVGMLVLVTRIVVRMFMVMTRIDRRMLELAAKIKVGMLMFVTRIKVGMLMFAAMIEVGEIKYMAVIVVVPVVVAAWIMLRLSHRLAVLGAAALWRFGRPFAEVVMTVRRRAFKSAGYVQRFAVAARWRRRRRRRRTFGQAVMHVPVRNRLHALKPAGQAVGINRLIARRRHGFAVIFMRLDGIPGAMVAESPHAHIDCSAEFCAVEREQFGRQKARFAERRTQRRRAVVYR
jgi:hypothetical protein